MPDPPLTGDLSPPEPPETRERPAAPAGSLRRLARRLVPFVGLALLIYWGSAFLLTHVPLEREAAVVKGWQIPHPDKFVHMAIYTGLSLLMSVWFGVRRRVNGALGVALAVLLLLGVYAAVDELTQGSVGRDPDVRDWFADMAGINLGLFGFFSLRRWLRR